MLQIEGYSFLTGVQEYLRRPQTPGSSLQTLQQTTAQSLTAPVGVDRHVTNLVKLGRMGMQSTHGKSETIRAPRHEVIAGRI